MKDRLSALWGSPPATGKATPTQGAATAAVTGQTEPTPGTAVTAPIVPQTGPYLPWGQEHTDTNDIEIRCKTGEWVQMREPYITGVEGTGDTIITLKTTSGAVTIEGRGLGELRRMIRHRKVDFIQEFDPQLWQAPDRAGPLIEQITIHQARGPQLVAQGPGR